MLKQNIEPYNARIADESIDWEAKINGRTSITSRGGREQTDKALAGELDIDSTDKADENSRPDSNTKRSANQTAHSAGKDTYVEIGRKLPSKGHLLHFSITLKGEEFECKNCEAGGTIRKNGGIGPVMRFGIVNPVSS